MWKSKLSYDNYFFLKKIYLSGVIPKTVMDSMEFLMQFHFPKQTSSKKGHRKRHSFKGKEKEN